MNSQQEYQHYLSVLRRARTFNTLLFYNQKLLSPYLLAEYGFTPSTAKQEEVEAKCEYCRAIIKLDPLTGDELFQVKDPIKYALRDHKEGCKMREFTNNFQHNPFFITQATVAKEGVLLHNEIVDSYEDELILNVLDLFENESVDIKQCIRVLIDKSLKDKRTTETIFSLLGWKCVEKEKKVLECQYCGAEEIFEENEFHLFESHRSTCILIREQMWKVILRQLTVYSLENIEGEFLKTKGLLKAKELRSELTNIFNSYHEHLEKFSTKMGKVKSFMEERYRNEGEEREENAGKRENMTSINELENISKQIENSLRESIKRVKIDFN